jgi:hypothetical protein
MLPRCGGMTASAFTRSPSRPCRSLWGSETAHARPQMRTLRSSPELSSRAFSDGAALCCTKTGPPAETQHLSFPPFSPKHASLLKCDSCK